MIPYPRVSPEIVRIGPLVVRWYGVMYLMGFASSYLLVRHEINKEGLTFHKDFVGSLYSYLILGLLIGARLGYIVFYDLPTYIKSPLEVFAVWHGGMSFHGGLIGSVVGGILCCRRFGVDPWKVSDLIIATVPLGLAFGRLGNFINGELYGRVADVPWAMVFPSGGPLSRHPSQLYEIFLEGILLFTVLWTLKNKGFRPGILSSLFIIFYGVVRFFVEFFREPDPQLGFVFGPLTMGQILSGAMMLLGAGIFYLRQKRT